MATTEQASSIESLVTGYGTGPDGLIPILQEIQEEQGYLSEESLADLARLTGISENEIYGVATFYTCFRFSPPAEHTVHVCLGTACHVRGGRQVLGEFENQLGIKPRETTPDGQFGLERVACVGCCALAPVAVVDGKVNAGMSPKKVRSLLKQYVKKDT